VNVGNVMMLRGPWNKPFLDELRMFPNGAHDDQVDALSRAFSELLRKVGMATALIGKNIPYDTPRLPWMMR
jgi:phage terminase large subunit-like protein